MAHMTEKTGVYHCSKIAQRNRWLFRAQPTDASGIDAYIEYIDSVGESRQLLALHIKSGANWFKEKKEGCAVFRDINERQYRSWMLHSVPCIVVLYNPEDGMCIWQKLTDKTIEKYLTGNENGFFVKVPLSQTFLDNSSHLKLLAFLNQVDCTTNYNFLLSQKKFMQIIQDGGIVKLHSIEWVANKNGGRVDMELIVDTGNGIEKYLHSYWFPHASYTEVFPKLFPWASFSVDEEFYEESDKSKWRDLHCVYDEFSGEMLVIGETFEEFRKKLDPMRSVEHSWEVAEYMLILKLNELGKSFLTVDEFVSK